MLFQNLDRIIAVLIAQGVVILIFFICAFKLLKKKTNRLSITASSFFLVQMISFIFNVVYFLIRIENVVMFFYFLTIFCIIFAPVHLLLFKLNIVKTKFDFTLQKQLVITVIYAIVLFCVLSIPGMFYIGPKTNWTPQWSITLFIIIFFYVVFGTLLPIWYYVIKIYKKITDQNIKAKWRFYIYGMIIISYAITGWLFYCTFWDETLRTLWNINVTIIFPIGCIFMYISMARQIQEKSE